MTLAGIAKIDVFSPHEFKGYTEMVSEVEIVDHVNYVVLVFSVLSKKSQNDRSISLNSSSLPDSPSF